MLPTLYQQTATGSIAFWQVWTDGSMVWTSWGYVGKKEQVKSYEAHPTNVDRANERNASQQALFEAQALWNKKRRLKYYVSIEEAKQCAKKDIRPLLAQKYQDQKDRLTFPVMVQPKLNGLRCIATKDYRLLSRGRKYYEMEHITKELAELPDGLNMFLDGELYIHGETLQKINSLVKDPRPESSKINFYVYDCFHGEGEEWKERCDNLVQFFVYSQPLEHIQMVETYVAHDENQIDQFHDLFVRRGYEGLIVRTYQHTYRYGYRSPGLLKMKKFEDKEFPIVGWTVSEKGIFIWVCKQEEGKLFEVVPKGTQEEKNEMLRFAQENVGKMLTVRFIGRTQDGIPVHAVGVCIRLEEDLDPI